MDDDTADLIRQLCTRAGMIMEDMSARAVLVGQASPPELGALLQDLEHAAEHIMALARAGMALASR